VRATHIQRVVVRSHGDVLLYNHLKPSTRKRWWDLAPLSLPRVGLSFSLPREVSRVRWLGRGPHENYPDRMEGAHVGLFEERVSELHTPYIVPSDNGERCDVRFLQALSPQGGLRVAAVGGEGRAGEGGGGGEGGGDARFGFSVSRYSLSSLEAATHSCELRESAEVELAVDEKVMGVGGDVSWHRSTYKRYWVPVAPYTWAVQLTPFGQNSHVEEQQRRIPPPPPIGSWVASDGRSGGWGKCLWRAMGWRGAGKRQGVALLHAAEGDS
ncbi:MAG: hypothetical protein SGPRY_004259, partial [Prymnesium sp.]